MPNWLKNKRLQRILIIAVCLVIYYVTENPGGYLPSGSSGDQALNHAIVNQLSDVQVTTEATILKDLPDDNRGSRHQRFLIRIDSGDVILVAHNIDLAPYVPDIRKGQPIKVSGEFEWNDKGGVIHWTHHDPRGKHIDGWIDYQGKRYQ